MATMNFVLLPAKKMADGKNKIRLRIAHNCQTRYIATEIIVNDNEFKDGRITKRPDKDILNLQLSKIYNKYFQRYLDVEYSEALTCTQLVEIISHGSADKHGRTFKDVADEYITTFDQKDRPKTVKLYRTAADRFVKETGENVVMEYITPTMINSFIVNLRRSKLSSTTINIYTTLVRVIINYAEKMQYVSYKVNPFVIAKIPQARKRETAITVQEMRAIRDADIKECSIRIIRDVFMLTYYLAGMNLVDMLAYDFRKKKVIEYVRRKTRYTKDCNNIISFDIPDEAVPIIERYINKNTGRLVFGKYNTYVSCYNTLTRNIPRLAMIGSVQHYFTLYSARKSFVQHGFDLGIPLSTLEYCIGQSMKEDRPIFNYVTIMKKHADEAVRKILDNLK